MHDGKQRHLHTKQQGRYANLDIRVRKRPVRPQKVQLTRSDRNRHRLPKRQEHNKLDGKDLGEGSVRGQLGGVAHLHVELDEHVHGDGDGGRLDGDDPHVAKHGAVGALAVLGKVLGDDGGDGGGHAHEAVLVDARPDDVEPGQAAAGGAPWS